jgi:hypothetical protein
MLILALLLWAANDVVGTPTSTPPVENSTQQASQVREGTAVGPAEVNADPERPQAGQAVASEQSSISVAPVPATTGTPGLFTVETAETLPKGVLTASSYVNKFSRAPGSVTVLNGGFSLAAGLTNKITLFAQFEPYRHLHVSQPSQLSLRQPAGCPHTVFDAPIYCGLNPGPLHNSWKGPAAGYVEGYPFAAFNNSDWGPVTLGFKVNFWSETRGDPLSVSLRTDFIIPTNSAKAELAKFGAQTGTFNYSFSLGLSRSFRHGILLANNVTYLVTRNPTSHGQTLLTPADEIIFGQGFIFFAEHRLQFLTEYTAVFPQEGHAFGVVGIETENTSLGPSTPIDGVWGVRWYWRKSAALDVGYRYMLNLHQVQDRNGFIFKISKSFGWSKPKERAP